MVTIKRLTKKIEITKYIQTFILFVHFTKNHLNLQKYTILKFYRNWYILREVINLNPHETHCFTFVKFRTKIRNLDHLDSCSVEWNIWEIRTKETNRRVVILHRSRIPDSWNHSCANAMRAFVVTSVRRHWTFFYRKVTW